MLALPATFSCSPTFNVPFEFTFAIRIPKPKHLYAALAMVRFSLMVAWAASVTVAIVHRLLAHVGLDPAMKILAPAFKSGSKWLITNGLITVSAPAAAFKVPAVG